MHPETVFCAQMILSAVLYAMGASQEANRIMERMGVFVERKAQFLRPNFRAVQTERAIQSGNAEPAREWLAVYANRSNRLPFYQISRHFATLRSHMALKDCPAAIEFGTRLHTLTTEYKRPLDQIESGLLTAIALWHSGEKRKSVKQLEQAVHVAMPYGFTQLFINEGKEALPLLWELRKSTNKAAGLMRFVDRLADTICKKHDLKLADEEMPKLTEQQRAMLPYLSKGMAYSEIAGAAGLGRGTVKSHVLLLYKRLGVSNAQEAVLKAKMLGLLK
jgi:LuxR family maltose regulon positive regulatory protein